MAELTFRASDCKFEVFEFKPQDLNDGCGCNQVGANIIKKKQ